MKIYDKAILEKVYPELKMSAAIPAAVYAPTNPDGTRPQAQFIITTDTAPLSAILPALLQFVEDERRLQNIALGFGEEHMPAAQKDAMDLHSEEGLFALLQYERPEWSEPCEVFTASGTTAEGVEFTFTLNAVIPSGQAFYTAVQYMFSKRNLNRLIAGLMPDDEDGDE